MKNQRVCLVLKFTALGLACESGPVSPADTKLRQPPHAEDPAPREVLSDAGPPLQQPAAPEYRELRAPSARSLPEALAPVFVPRRAARLWSGAASGKPQLVPLHGFLDDEPVRGMLSVQSDRLTLDLASITSGVSTKYRGRAEQSAFSDGDLECKGRIQATDKARRALQVSLFLPGSPHDVRAVPAGSEGNPITTFGPGFPRHSVVQTIRSTRDRFELEGRDAPEADSLSLELAETADDPKNLLEPYRAALRTAADFEAGVQTPSGTTLLAYSVRGSELKLGEFSGSPLALKRSVTTGLKCDPGDACKARLTGYDLGGGAVVIVAILEGGAAHGQGIFRSGQAELWTVTTDGFAPGAKLPKTESADTAHGAEHGRSTLHWVDADGAPPLEILVLHSARTTPLDRAPLPERRRPELFAVLPGDRGYTKVSATPETPLAALTASTRGRGFVEF